MKLFGALGIDWKILIIQAINFLILFLILKGLFFKPFVKALKEEKKKEEEIKAAEQEIERKKEEWQKERQAQALEAKAKVERLIAEAEKAEQESKKRIKEEEIEKEKMAIERIRKQSEAILDKFKEELSRDYKEKATASLLRIFMEVLSGRAKEVIQDSFWPMFVKELEKANFSCAGSLAGEEEFSRISRSLPTEIKKDIQLKRVSVRIFSAYPISSSQKKTIKKILKEKISGKKIKIESEIDKNLIAGFRLEIGGILVEQSLAEKIKNLFN